MIRLRIWANARPMGWFGHVAADYFFEYDPQWLEQPGHYVLAPQFPLVAERYTGHLVRSFFENLLPEGEALDDIVSAIHLRGASSFELLGRLGAELPGVLSLLPPEARPVPAQEYRPLPFEELSRRLAGRDRTPLLLSNTQATMSLAGAQDKIGLRFDPAGQRLSDSIGQSPTTHILKPDTRQARYHPSAVNEFACMKLARALRLPVPEVWLLRIPEAAYVVERYDRLLAAGNIVSLHQVDGCQLLGHGADWKYQRSGGLVSIPLLVKVLRGLGVRGIDLLQFQRWVMFNYLIGNSDAHAKNVSVLVDDKGFRLAPFYDLLCVRAYGDAGLALFIGDEETFDSVGRHSWEALCEDCGFRLPETLAEFGKMARALLPAWHKVRASLDKSHDPNDAEVHVLERMTHVFELHARNALSMIGG
ncbi:serine/threonine-protein kinase HipA [Variovorax boronicumulans]|uniref:HipA domain-containing protein n=1 Tax=Variovorax boronicumulans TaxID=436515 RepID=UPI00277FAE02|nr:HipA domain-containing protein [Variovorax boronicumulans]MDQ0086235.1 serine/threonine-protein kinase HipA [Variovorax boronicumulans]